MLAVLGAFFVIGPSGGGRRRRADGPGGLAGARAAAGRLAYLVFGALATLALSVAVSQLGIEPQGMKQVIEFVPKPGRSRACCCWRCWRRWSRNWCSAACSTAGWPAAGARMAAFIVSSLAFAAAHFEPAHVVLVLPLGLLFGWLRRRTDSLLPSLVAHIVNNGFALLQLRRRDLTAAHRRAHEIGALERAVQ